MIDKRKLQQMRNVNITQTDPGTLTDISDIHIDSSLSRADKMENYFEQTVNPYCFRCGDTAVKLEFADNGPPLQDIMTGFLVRQKSGL